MTDSQPWADLADSDETFLRFYHAFEPDCRRRVARRYRSTALRWKLCCRGELYLPCISRKFKL
jgi:hypothetical protein